MRAGSKRDTLCRGKSAHSSLLSSHKFSVHATRRIAVRSLGIAATPQMNPSGCCCSGSERHDPCAQPSGVSTCSSGARMLCRCINELPQPAEARRCIAHPGRCCPRSADNGIKKLHEIEECAKGESVTEIPNELTPRRTYCWLDLLVLCMRRSFVMH